MTINMTLTTVTDNQSTVNGMINIQKVQSPPPTYGTERGFDLNALICLRISIENRELAQHSVNGAAAGAAMGCVRL